jgi:hypothetical protein
LHLLPTTCTGSSVGCERLNFWLVVSTKFNAHAQLPFLLEAAGRVLMSCWKSTDESHAAGPHQCFCCHSVFLCFVMRVIIGLLSTVSFPVDSGSCPINVTSVPFFALKSFVQHLYYIDGAGIKNQEAASDNQQEPRTALQRTTERR